MTSLIFCAFAWIKQKVPRLVKEQKLLLKISFGHATRVISIPEPVYPRGGRMVYPSGKDTQPLCAPHRRPQGAPTRHLPLVTFPRACSAAKYLVTSGIALLCCSSFCVTFVFTFASNKSLPKINLPSSATAAASRPPSDNSRNQWPDGARRGRSCTSSHSHALVCAAQLN
jgi:hypothetical protein